MVWFQVVLGDFKILVFIEQYIGYGYVYIVEIYFYVVVWGVVEVEDLQSMFNFDVGCVEGYQNY